jgi:nitroreductase
MPEHLPPTQLLKLMHSLRSVRRFAPTAIPDDVVSGILDVGRWTGSSKNTQPWEVVVVVDRADLSELSTLGLFAKHIANASLAMVLVLAPGSSGLDAGRLAERLMLAGWAHDVGSCIGSIFPKENQDRAKALLQIPPDRQLHTVLSFGYPADDNATRLSSTPNMVTVMPSIGRKPMSEFAYFGQFGSATGPAGTRR